MQHGIFFLLLLSFTVETIFTSVRFCFFGVFYCWDTTDDFAKAFCIFCSVLHNPLGVSELQPCPLFGVVFPPLPLPLLPPSTCFCARPDDRDTWPKPVQKLRALSVSPADWQILDVFTPNQPWIRSLVFVSIIGIFIFSVICLLTVISIQYPCIATLFFPRNTEISSACCLFYLTFLGYYFYILNKILFKPYSRAKQTMLCYHKWNSDSLFRTHSTVEDHQSDKLKFNSSSRKCDLFFLS